MNRLSKFVLATTLILFVVGCNNVSPEVALLVKAASTSAHERALAFSLQAKNIQAVKSDEAVLIQEYVRAHGSGLNLDAKALNDLHSALTLRLKANVHTKSVLREMHITSVERAKLFSAMRKHLSTKNTTDNADFARWLDAHSEGLTALADSMGMIVKKLDAEKATAKKEN